MNRLSRRHLGALALSFLVGAALSASPVDETLATYADREFANGQLSGSAWNMQAKVSTDSWSEYFTTAIAGTFTWTPSSLGMGAWTYASVDLHLAAGSPLGATVSLAAPTLASGDSTLWADLRYHAYLTSSAATTCDGSTGITSTITAKGSTMSTAGGSTWTLGAPTVSAAGATTRLCLGVGLVATPNSASNGKSAAAQWTLTAQSN